MVSGPLAARMEAGIRRGVGFMIQCRSVRFGCIGLEFPVTPKGDVDGRVKTRRGDTLFPGTFAHASASSHLMHYSRLVCYRFSRKTTLLVVRAAGSARVISVDFRFPSGNY